MEPVRFRDYSSEFSVSGLQGYSGEKGIQTDEIERGNKRVGGVREVKESGAGVEAREVEEPELSLETQQKLARFLRGISADLLEELEQFTPVEVKRKKVEVPGGPSILEGASLSLQTEPEEEISCSAFSGGGEIVFLGVGRRGHKALCGHKGKLIGMRAGWGKNSPLFELELPFCPSALLSHPGKPLAVVGGATGEIWLVSTGPDPKLKRSFPPLSPFNEDRVLLLDWIKCRVNGQRKLLLLSVCQAGRVCVWDIAARANPKRAFVVSEPLALVAASRPDPNRPILALLSAASRPILLEVPVEYDDLAVGFADKQVFDPEAIEMLSNLPQNQLLDTLAAVEADSKRSRPLGLAQLAEVAGAERLLRPVHPKFLPANSLGPVVCLSSAPPVVFLGFAEQLCVVPLDEPALLGQTLPLRPSKLRPADESGRLILALTPEGLALFSLPSQAPPAMLFLKPGVKDFEAGVESGRVSVLVENHQGAFQTFFLVPSTEQKH